jgi:hypothetical protein
VRAARAGQINKYDAYDQRGFDAFTESDKKSRKHRIFQL